MKWRDVLPKPVTTNRINPTSAELRAGAALTRTFPVDRLVDIPRDEWPAAGVSAKMVRAARCRDFLVQVYQEPGDIIRLSIQRTELDRNTGRWKDGISWDDLQHLKTLAGFADRTAVELYPPLDQVVNVANIRHLWLIPGECPFMWRGRS